VHNNTDTARRGVYDGVMQTAPRMPLILALTVALSAVVWAADDRTALKPGWNMFSLKQDVEIGQQVSPDAERQLLMLRNARLDDYVNTLGRKLAAKAPGEDFPYSFKVVNDSAINAFALPGGPIYINRGVIEAADNEAQLAGVLAHEISHVAMRHGTNQASKASAAQLPLAILGGLIGSDSTKAALTQLGASFAVNSILLKYSRTAETQADIMGTQILYDAGYDPRAMGQFFQQIEADQEGGGAVQFFSNHPSPDNRIERVNEEVTLLGGARRNSVTSSREFDDAVRQLQSLPGPTSRPQVSAGGGRPQLVRGDLRIVSASYGAGDRFIDVRQRLQSRVEDDRLDVQIDNSSMGGDPNRNRAETLRLRYEWAGRQYDTTIYENQWLTLPTDQQVREGTIGTGTTIDWPSNRFTNADNDLLRIGHPDNWQAHGQGDAMTITPQGGLINDGQGNQALAYGVIINIFEPGGNTYGQQLQSRGFGQPSTNAAARLEDATDRLIQELRLSNRNMRVIRNREAIQVDGARALSTYLSNDSPVGGRETDWLVTMAHPDGLLFLVFAAPEREAQTYEATFHQMLRSLRVKR
jgi:Zn-dependent protease with chaperone function